MAMGAFVFVYVYFSFSAHHWLTWADFTPLVIWRLLGCVFILALFPIILLPVMMAFKKAHPGAEPLSLFYRDWASVFTGTGKGGGGRIVFFAENAEQFRIEASTFRKAPVKVVAITFRKTYFFKRGDERFVVQADAEGVPDKMIAWARDHDIEVVEVSSETS